jgi:hypothetical protein
MAKPAVTGFTNDEASVDANKQNYSASKQELTDHPASLMPA